MKGWPDYTKVTGIVENYDEYGKNYPIGIGDGAARLGSIKTYDMRGRVLWMDDFEAPTLHWQTVNAGVGGSQALSTLHARNGNQSAALVTNTGFVRKSQISKYLPQPRKERIGIEVSAYIPATFGELTIYFRSYDGTDASYSAVKLQEATSTILYLNSGGGWTDTGLTWCENDNHGLFNTLKMVIDYSKNEYVRILYNHEEVDLIGTLTQVFGWIAPPYTWTNISANGDNINNTACYIDDVIMTTMEPE